MSGVYISYPLCNQKCSFCNFASDVYSAGSKQQYERALLSELQAQAWTWRPETLYLGGGTPSLMSLDLLRALIDCIPRDRLAESTIECAPGTVTKEKAEGWRDAGINRVSLGVQSFDATELRHTGRCHTATTVEQDVALLRECGIGNINLDLIAGLPHQTRNSWGQSLNWIERLGVPHVSIYIFEIDEDSRLGQEILLGGQRYSAGFLPAPDLAAEFYETGVERLRTLGLQRYEISNFAKPGYESHHNLKYWKLEPYLGFGLDAHSFDGGMRWSNPENLDEYLRRPSSATGDREACNPSEEHFYVGLRLMEGIQPSEEEWQMFAEPIGKWTQAGLLKRHGATLRLSPAAVLVSNEIFQEFLLV